MMDPKIEKYKFEGKIFLWEYKENPRNFPGWNLTADNAGADNICALLDLMNDSAYPSKKRIKIDRPSENQLKACNNGSSVNIKQFLELNFKKDDSNETWQIKILGDILQLTFDNSRIKEFKESIMRMKNGRGDFAISDESENNILYFWWNLDN